MIEVLGVSDPNSAAGVELRLEVDREPTQRRDGVGQVDGQDDSCN